MPKLAGVGVCGEYVPATATGRVPMTQSYITNVPFKGFTQVHWQFEMATQLSDFQICHVNFNSDKCTLSVKILATSRRMLTKYRYENWHIGSSLVKISDISIW